MIRIEKLNKYYNRHKKNEIHVINNTTLTLPDKGLIALLGPSGCGKTTLLKILIGIEAPTSGDIVKNGKMITNLDPSKREMGMVFQNYALFPNMNVLDNVMYALNLKLKNKEKASS